MRPGRLWHEVCGVWHVIHGHWSVYRQFERRERIEGGSSLEVVALHEQRCQGQQRESVCGFLA